MYNFTSKIVGSFGDAATRQGNAIDLEVTGQQAGLLVEARKENGADQFILYRTFVADGRYQSDLIGVIKDIGQGEFNFVPASEVWK